MEHFDPLMWVIENPATGLLKTRPFMERLPWVDVTYCIQEAYPTVDQHALETEPRAMQERQPVRRVGGQGGPRLMGGQRERVRGQSHELLYSIPTALCEEIARAATAELADRLPG